MPVGSSRIVKSTLAVLDLPPGPWRAVFAWRGGLTLTSDAEEVALVEGDGAPLGRGGCRITAAPDRDACCFVWEVDGPDTPAPTGPDGTDTVASYDMPPLPGEDGDTAREAVLRFERVDLHAGVETPRHTHRGSGLRVLTSGRIDADIDGRRMTLRPGDAWLEKGPGEAVVGRAARDGPTAFVRLLVLPADCAGKDSFVYLGKGEAQRPRPAAYRRFFEERVSL